MVAASTTLALEADAAVTVSFLTLALAQVWHVFNMTEPGQGAIANDVTRNPYVWGAILLCLVLVLLACYLPPLAAVLKLTEPDGPIWAVILVASLLSMAAGRIALLAIGRLAGSRPA
jgi:Ca2+-transporting ATPase